MRMAKSTSRFPRKKTPTAFGPPTREPTPEWQATVGTYLAGQAEVDEMDLVAIEMEKKWGVDRLRLLVPVDLREKFDRQRYLVNQALWHGQLEDVRQQSKRMISAWRALDRAAEATRAPERDPEVWEVILDDGSVAALVRTGYEARKVNAEGREMQVFTLDEIGRLLSGFPALAAAKAVFPGATVTKTKTAVHDPLQGIPDSKAPIDDSLPW